MITLKEALLHMLDPHYVDSHVLKLLSLTRRVPEHEDELTLPSIQNIININTVIAQI